VERDLIRTRTAGQEPRQARGKHMADPFLYTRQQNEATRRRTQGATLQELTDSYAAS